MKKVALGIIAILIAVAIYFMTSGSAQITEEIKKQVNTELTSIQTEGFSVQNREINEETEHFVLSFDEPQKYAQFFTRQGIQLNVNDAEFLKGLQFGVDVNYLPDTYSSISVDMYPLTLPSVLTSSVDAEDKKALEKIQTMLDNKTFLIHIAVNKLGNGFKGHMKDINEVLDEQKNVKLTMEGLTFSGDINNEKIQNISQNLKKLSITIPNELDMSLHNLVSTYTVTGKTAYDYRTHYKIEKVIVDGKSQFNAHMEDMTMESTSSVANGLANGTMNIETKSINIANQGKKYFLDTFKFDIDAKGLDMTAFEKLQEINVNDQEELDNLVKQMLSKGVTMMIPTLSVANIESEGQKMGGFEMTANIDLDKSFDISALETNPMSVLSSINANLDFTLSNDLFSVIAQQPQAMMALMIFQPKNVDNKKVYNLELKDGKFTVNGMPMI